ncbi:S8 family serine peptidase [Chryseosolibacter indicus]|uniref:S8 family serine peptidase n=1 Tax=Chryseosolibacter indicus TaxID=2782351 RepID=A0ABS5VRJ4_9BACT|nr:S8 family serine peptidase [Chryseosolibacter indicus]MBT1704043.1 S8 family serine peptidase [Chryseosolibacter indicus]
MFKSLIQTTILISISAFLSCNEEPEVETKPTVDNCLTTSSIKQGQIIEGDYIVTFTSSGSSNGRLEAARAAALKYSIPKSAIRREIEGERAHLLMQLSADKVEELKKDTNILSIEPDRVISICACFNVIEPRSVTWNVEKVGYGDGTNKTAWIIDTGIDSDHPDLNVNTKSSKSFLEGNDSFEDDNGHGTHIGGIIGALNNRIGTLGVASGASLVALKVLDENGDGKLSGLLAALSYVRSNAKAGDVVNISVGFEDASQTLENEIKSIANRGVFFALAAGNESTKANTYSPARTSGNNIYTVSAVDSLNRFANFSNFGNDVVDYAAPGVRILSAYKNGKYAILSGTSMAAPHVAGILLINSGKINSAGTALNDPDDDPDPIAHK